MRSSGMIVVGLVVLGCGSTTIIEGDPDATATVGAIGGGGSVGNRG
jgi:hypothetical protein